MLKSEIINEGEGLETVFARMTDRRIPRARMAEYVSAEFDQAIVRNINKLTLEELNRLPKDVRDMVVIHVAFAYERSRSMECYDKLVELMMKSDDICLAIVKRAELAAIGTPGGHTLGNLAVCFSEIAKFYVLGSEHLFLRDFARMNTVYNKLLRVNGGKITVPAQQ